MAGLVVGVLTFLRFLLVILSPWQPGLVRNLTGAVNDVWQWQDSNRTPQHSCALQILLLAPIPELRWAWLRHGSGSSGVHFPISSDHLYNTQIILILASHNEITTFSFSQSSPIFPTGCEKTLSVLVNMNVFINQNTKVKSIMLNI